MIATQLKQGLQQAGTAAGEKVYHDIPAQPVELPYLIISEVDGGEVVNHLGGADGLNQTIWQVYILAETRAEVDALAQEVRTYLERFSGPMGSPTVHIDDAVMLTPGRADVDRSTDKGYHPRFYRITPFQIWHRF